MGHFSIVGSSNGFSAPSASSLASSALKKPQQTFNAEFAEAFAETGERDSSSNLVTTKFSTTIG